jgi:hypothetical protein
MNEQRKEKTQLGDGKGAAPPMTNATVLLIIRSERWLEACGDSVEACRDSLMSLCSGAFSANLLNPGILTLRYGILEVYKNRDVKYPHHL